MTIDKFISELASVENSDSMNNPYRNELQRENLKLYLGYFIENPPDCLFVGEAPGHNGCLHTGIAFTDEYRFIKEKARYKPLANFDENNVILQNRRNPHEEKSAGIIWPALKENDFFPLLWNIVPFYTHKPGKSECIHEPGEKSGNNRTPTAAEITIHWHFINDVLELFSTIKFICAVGETSFNGLERYKDLIKRPIYPEYIPHPANRRGIKPNEKIKEVAELLRRKNK